MTACAEWTVAPTATIGGVVNVPGDKSISHRIAMLAGIASGVSEIDGFLASEDCLHTLDAMAALGAGVERAGTQVTIRGVGGCPRSPGHVLDMGNSGTGMRLLAGLLAGQRVTAEMTGDASLRSRPMRRIQQPLAAMGANVELLGADGRPPIRILPAAVHALRYELPMASAQVKSCVLLAALGAAGETTVVEPRATRDHTERVLLAMGADLTVQGLTVRMRGTGRTDGLRAGTWRVPGDFSSAAFWIVAAACREGAVLTVDGVGLNPRRTALLDVLRRMGASIDCQCDPGSERWEPRGRVTVRGARLIGATVKGDEIPNLIDEIPLVAVAGALARGTTTIAEAGELRVKESDRILTMTRGLRAMGVSVDERPDGMVVTGGGAPRGGVAIESFGDHRIAMAFSVLALSASAPVRIVDTACVDTSYPGFARHLEEIACRGA